MSTDGSYAVHLAYVNSVDADDVAVVKIPALTGQDSLKVYPEEAAGWTPPVAGEQRFVAVSHEASDVRWLV